MAEEEAAYTACKAVRTYVKLLARHPGGRGMTWVLCLPTNAGRMGPAYRRQFGCARKAHPNCEIVLPVLSAQVAQKMFRNRRCVVQAGAASSGSWGPPCVLDSWYRPRGLATHMCRWRTRGCKRVRCACMRVQDALGPDCLSGHGPGTFTSCGQGRKRRMRVDGLAFVTDGAKWCGYYG